MSCYVDPTTGETHDTYAEGLVEVDLDEPAREPDDDSRWLGDWYTQQVARLAAEERALKQQHERRLERVEGDEFYVRPGGAS